MVLTAGDHGALLLNRGRYYCLKFSPSLFSTQQIKCFSVIQCWCMYDIMCFGCFLLDSRGAKVRQPQFPLPVCCRMAEASLCLNLHFSAQLPWPVTFLTLCPVLFGFCLHRCLPCLCPQLPGWCFGSPQTVAGAG